MAQYSANAMKIYNEQIALQSTKPREVVAITTQVKAAMEKSGFRDGMVLVSSLHSNTAIIVSDAEVGLLEDLDNWLTEIAPARDDYKHAQRFESNAAIHFQSLLLHHQAMVPFSEARLDLGSSQAVLFVELDGLRPRRIVIKVLGQ
jgi:secondary thiamine-phosphate synthase enzyme